MIPALRDLLHDPDRTALHVLMADEAYAVGAGPSSESYLNLERVLEMATSSAARVVGVADTHGIRPGAAAVRTVDDESDQIRVERR